MPDEQPPPHVDPETGEIYVRPFGDWLREQDNGSTHDELSEALHDLIARVRDTGKKGTLTLVVNVAPLKNDVDVLIVDDEIKLKLPEHDRKGSLFYTTKAGNLSRQDPRQLAFDHLREVPAPRRPVESTPDIAQAGEEE